jgi:pimeloyl-ACP methyl ester carboxylesterase
MRKSYDAWRSAAALVLAITAGVGVHVDGQAQALTSQLAIVHLAPAGEWSAYRLRNGPLDVDVFLMHDDRRKPVVILLQGSGCLPAFTVDEDGSYRTTSLFQDAIARALQHVHFAIVEKRGVEPVRFAANMTQAQKVARFDRAGIDCTTDFYEHATKDARVADALSLTTALAAESWASTFLLVGHSEGSHVATGILKSHPPASITAAALFASAGPTPFWGGAYAASGTDARAEFERSLSRLREIQRAPDSAMFDGLPARRYKTFWIQSTPMDDVKGSDVPLFVAQGSRDGTLLPADLFVMEAVRQNPARPVRYVVLQEGNHAFEQPDGRSRVVELFNDFLQWALDPAPATSTRVVQ